jgi:small-conductance mechanosensitive channel
MTDVLGTREVWLAAAAILLLGALTAVAVGALVSFLTRRVLGDRERAARLAAASVWVVLAVFVVAALSRLLGPDVAQPGLTTAATRLLARIPDILIALLLVVVGLVLASAVRGMARRLLDPVQPGVSRTVAPIAYWAVVALALLLAAEQIGVRTGAVERVLLIALAGVVFAVALGFGLGTRDLIAAVVAGRHVERILAVGDEVEVGGVRGEVVAVDHASVRLRLPNGEAEVPHPRLLADIVVVHRRRADEPTRSVQEPA